MGRVALSEFGECVMRLARKKKIRSQAALVRVLEGSGFRIPKRTLAYYLQGKTVVDPALPKYLVTALRLNKKERRELAEAYTFGQPPRGEEFRRAG